MYSSLLRGALILQSYAATPEGNAATAVAPGVCTLPPIPVLPSDGCPKEIRPLMRLSRRSLARCMTCAQVCMLPVHKHQHIYTVYSTTHANPRSHARSSTEATQVRPAGRRTLRPCTYLHDALLALQAIWRAVVRARRRAGSVGAGLGPAVLGCGRAEQGRCAAQPGVREHGGKADALGRVGGEDASEQVLRLCRQCHIPWQVEPASGIL